MKKYRLFLLSIVFISLCFFIAASYVERGDRYFTDTVNFAKATKCSLGNGVATTGATTGEYGSGEVHKSVFTVSKTITTADSAGTGGYGSYKLYDFPAGAVTILGSEVNLSATSAGSPHYIVAAADGDFSLGTAACNAGSLTSTEADIIASTEIAQFATTAGIIKGYGNPIATAFDGTSTAKDLYLNIIFDDADSGGADTLTVTGTVTVYWINLGDY